MMMFWYENDHMGVGGWALMILGVVAFWGLMVFALVVLIHSPGRAEAPSHERPAQPMRERLLAERFTRGEFDETEYAGRLAVLRKRARP
ncbi:MAG: hypothetical protein ACXVXP_10560 [Mycobacteriaceae bacterium]|jgi:putative membrane protein